MKPYRIANTLTLCRLIAIPVVIFLLFRSQKFPQYQLIVLLVLVCMQATDILDGYLARLDRKKTATNNPFGQIMDPIADKLYINSTYLTLSFTHNFPGWIAVIIFSRDILLTSGWIIRSLITKDKSINPNFLGKVCDSCQAICIFALLLNLPLKVKNFAVILTVCITIISGISYFWRDFSIYLFKKGGKYYEIVEK